MVAPGYWDQLSISSKKALQWAAVMAALRSERSTEVSTQGVDVYDLFVGILLSHTADSEAKILLNHFALLPGQVLPEDYPSPDEKDLQRQLTLIPANQLPQTDPQVSEIVEIAMKHGQNTGSLELVELRALYVALFEVSNPLSSRIDELISSRGASFSEILRINQDYLDGEESDQSYEKLLKECLPYNILRLS